MTRDEYNKKMQTIQALWPANGQRLYRRWYKENLNTVLFQVYLDRWRTLGEQRRPFKPDTEYRWDDEEEARVLYHFAGGITAHITRAPS